MNDKSADTNKMFNHALKIGIILINMLFWAKKQSNDSVFLINLEIGVALVLNPYRIHHINTVNETKCFAKLLNLLLMRRK